MPLPAKKAELNGRGKLLAAVMLLAFLAASLLGARQKHGLNEKVRLADLVPPQFMNWSGITHPTDGYRDKWQSINELLVREYFSRPQLIFRRPRSERVGFILEYTSDLRKNFAFHFPEDCHRSSGNQIEFLEPVEIRFEDGRTLRARTVFIRGMSKSYEPVDKLVVYWLVLDGRQRHETVSIKLDQMFAGLLSGSKKGTLVRADYFENVTYTPESIGRARKTIEAFLRDLYRSLGPAQRDVIFGRP